MALYGLTSLEVSAPSRPHRSPAPPRRERPAVGPDPRPIGDERGGLDIHAHRFGAFHRRHQPESTRIGPCPALSERRGKAGLKIAPDAPEPHQPCGGADQFVVAPTGIVLPREAQREGFLRLLVDCAETLPNKRNRLGIACLNHRCDWNEKHRSVGRPVSLLLLLADTDIF